MNNVINNDKPSKDKPSKKKPSKDKPSKDKLSKDKPSKDKPSKDKLSDNYILNKLLLKNNTIKLQEIIKKSVLSANKYKFIDIISASELNTCVESLENIFAKLKDLQVTIDSDYNEQNTLSTIEELTNELSNNFRTFGTENITDLISVCFGNDIISKIIDTSSDVENKVKIINKLEIMNKYVHPISYRIISWKNNKEKPSSAFVFKKNRIIEDFLIVDSAVNLECFDLSRTSKSFQNKVYGLKFAIQHVELKKTIIIFCLVDDLQIECLNYTFVISRINDIYKLIPTDFEYNVDCFKRFVSCLTLKDLLIYNNSELYERYSGYMNQISLIKTKSISDVAKEFMSNDLYGQRTTMIQLLIKSNEHEFQYLAYLLYDLLTNDFNGSVDTYDQTLLYDSLPWNIKKYFRDAMNQTITYTNNLSIFDNNKIPLEQQICLMKVSDAIKEKAMLKLKEIKSKSDDSGSKAKQYLDGLLKIPFGIYKKESILCLTQENSLLFNDIIIEIKKYSTIQSFIPDKKQYNPLEIKKYLQIIKNKYYDSIKLLIINNIKHVLTTVKRNSLISNVCYINALIKTNNIDSPKICHSGKKILHMKSHINDFINVIKNNFELLMEICKYFKINLDVDNLVQTLTKNITTIESNNDTINKYMHGVSSVLDSAIYGHDKAKRQIERIIAQWINGENSGYCFGFEGSPGLGKTSMAKKGISSCLKDINGISRPFSFIAVGGSSNGSTLEGHNYTYVGSTWGKIVDILMDNKCMNPIIFIDELDKISNTEHGKELIGILTHLIDPTQNDTFQDKYFNGIDLDLSKALFIFSYNDSSLIDKILLDRIHRIKFDNLSLEDKLIITKNHLIPEICTNMGVTDVVSMNDDIIEYIIQNYTNEPGVRKLKEILFEIIGEINLTILKENKEYELPINITIDDIKYKYLNNNSMLNAYYIHSVSRIGLINGLWANSLGNGGVLPIEVLFYPSNTLLDFKLTGMQGDVMKESMNVAKTLAWSLLSEEKMIYLQKTMDETKSQGLHIHVPEGATPKDGPSAGTAITVLLYSILNKQKIKHDFAITGEISLQGNVTAIGGLSCKIIGGIRGGVKTFIFPKENDKDFVKFMEKYKGNKIIEGITFIQVSNIQEVLEIIFTE